MLSFFIVNDSIASPFIILITDIKSNPCFYYFYLFILLFTNNNMNNLFLETD